MLNQPITIDEVISAGSTLTQVAADETGCYWLETIPDEDGRASIKRWEHGQIVDLTPSRNVRTRINSYGGGAYAVNNGRLAFVDDETNAVWIREPNGSTRQLTSDNGFYGGLFLSASYLYAVRESNEKSALVRITLANASCQVLASGADFYTHICANEKHVAWIAWNQPAMPWDSTGLFIDGQLVDGDPSAGLDGVSIAYPLWQSDGSLVYLSDSSGFYNLVRYDKTYQPLHEDSHDFAICPWLATNSAHAELNGGHLVAWRREDGWHSLGVLADGAANELAVFAEVDSLASANGVGYGVVLRADAGPAVVRVTDKVEVIYEISTPARLLKTVVVPESFTFTGSQGKVQAWVYLPDTDQSSPLNALVMVHGGPTLFSHCGLDWRKQYWVSRGIAVVDVNYSGSGGFGRDYRNRLRRNWAISDVADVQACVKALRAANKINKAAIYGSSAGGLTVYWSLIRGGFVGGISRYGVADITKLVGGPKFEAKYFDSLVGVWPKERARYEERSPINHAHEISAPLLMLQGSADPIVPLAQSQAMAKALADSGIAHKLMVFDGEGHGFRSPEANRRALQAQSDFLEKLF